MKAAAPLVMLFACGCGSQALEGSLSEIFKLEYARAELARTDEEVTLRFINPQGSGEDTVLQVTAKLEGVKLTADEALDLAELLEDGVTQRGSLTRNVFGDPLQTFPPLEKGQLLLSSLPIRGESVSGEFSATFALGTEFASGRTVFGDFEAQVP